jgi:hypothetical protein
MTGMPAATPAEPGYAPASVASNGHTAPAWSPTTGGSRQSGRWYRRGSKIVLTGV